MTQLTLCNPVHPNGGLIFKPPTEICDTGFQPGGWLPTIYLDRDGNEVDIHAVAETVERAAKAVAKTAKQERRKKRILSVSEHVVNALKSDRRPDQDKLDYLRRQLAEKAHAARQLARAIEAQRQDDDDVATILLMVH